MEATTDRLEAHVFGAPGGDTLEIRLNKRIDHELKDTNKKLDRITWLVGIGVGIMGTLQTFLVIFAARLFSAMAAPK